MDELTQRMFKVLDIPETAQLNEIEAKYRELVRRYQAEQSSGDPEAWQRLKEASSAYEIVRKYWSERNAPQQGSVSYRQPDITAPGPVIKKKRSAAPTVIVIVLVCIAIMYYGYPLLKRQRPETPANVVQGELRLFMTSQ